MSKTLYILRGLPGAGKSTLGKLLADFRCFAADDFFIDVNGVYKFDPTKLGAAHGDCRNRVEAAMKTPQSDGGKGDSYRICEEVAVANTFTTRKEMEPYFILAYEHDYTIQIIHCEFVGSTRVNGNIVGFGSDHSVPDAAMARMAGRWEPFKL